MKNIPRQFRKLKKESITFGFTETTESENVTFNETIVTRGKVKNKSIRKFNSNPVTRSSLDVGKVLKRSTLKDYENSLEKGLKIGEELIIPRAISEEEEAIEEMSEEELLREYQDISNALKHDHIKFERRV